MNDSTIPIVDINNETRDAASIAQEIDKALSQVGFMYLKGHGISEETVQSVFVESKKFFDLDIEIKNSCRPSETDDVHSCGYIGMDRTLKAGNSHRETFNLAPQFRERVKKEMPTEATPLISIFGNVMTESQPVVRQLLSIFAKSLELDDEEYFWKRCIGLCNSDQPNSTRIKTCYYPYITGMIAGTERCTNHYDASLMTLLWLDQGECLQVKNKSGEWFSVGYIPGTIIVNTGILLEYWSGGRYPTTVHRVVYSENDVVNKLDRQSMAYFIFADDDVLISPFLTNTTKNGAILPGDENVINVKQHFIKDVINDMAK